LAYADVRELMDSELRSKLMGLRGAREGQREIGPGSEFYEATGLDVEKDVDHLVASFAGDGPKDGPPLVVARGRFNTGLIETPIREHADGQPRVDSYRGVRVVTVAFRNEEQPNAAGSNVSVAFAEPGLLVLGTEGEVRRALDAKATGANVTGNADVMNLVR